MGTSKDDKYKFQKRVEEVDKGGELTQWEINHGWHFCPDWDFMLIYPGCPEYTCCTCNIPIKRRGRPPGSKNKKKVLT